MNFACFAAPFEPLLQLTGRFRRTHRLKAPQRIAPLVNVN